MNAENVVIFRIRGLKHRFQTRGDLVDVTLQRDFHGETFKANSYASSAILNMPLIKLSLLLLKENG